MAENFSAGLTFMRSNPFTIGHLKVVDKLNSLDVDRKFIYFSHSQDKLKNPLPYEIKVAYARTFLEDKYPEVEIITSDAKTIIDSLKELYEMGCNKVIVVVGSDRVEDFERLANTYNNKPNKKGEILYKFDSIEVISAGERNDEDEVSSMSATKARQFVKDDDFESFKKAIPCNDEMILRDYFEDLKSYM